MFCAIGSWKKELYSLREGVAEQGGLWETLVDEIKRVYVGVEIHPYFHPAVCTMGLGVVDCVCVCVCASGRRRPT